MATTTRVRDVQRSKVYRAEDTVRTGEHLGSIEGVRAFLDRIDRMPWFRATYGRSTRSISLSDGRGRTRAAGSAGRLWLPLWSRTERVVLHELAHALTPGERHGPVFARCYLDLVEHVMGAQTARSLRAAFREHRVKVGPVVRADAAAVRATAYRLKVSGLLTRGHALVTRTQAILALTGDTGAAAALADEVHAVVGELRRRHAYGLTAEPAEEVVE